MAKIDPFFGLLFDGPSCFFSLFFQDPNSLIIADLAVSQVLWVIILPYCRLTAHTILLVANQLPFLATPRFFMSEMPQSLGLQSWRDFERGFDQTY
jgi:hypothetical protein